MDNHQVGGIVPYRDKSGDVPSHAFVPNSRVADPPSEAQLDADNVTFHIAAYDASFRFSGSRPSKSGQMRDRADHSPTGRSYRRDPALIATLRHNVPKFPNGRHS